MSWPMMNERSAGIVVIRVIIEDDKTQLLVDALARWHSTTTHCPANLNIPVLSENCQWLLPN